MSEETVGRIWLYVISEPDLGYTYYVSLTPINKNGVEGATTTVSATTLEDSELALPARPSNLRLSTNYKTIELQWQEPLEEISLIESYRIYRSQSKYSVNFSNYSLIDTAIPGTQQFIDY